MEKEYLCLECGKLFKVESDDPLHIMSKLGKCVKKHIREDHNITIEDYVIKHYFNGIRPTCKCGCNKELKFHPKNCLFSESHGFTKYYNSGHCHKLSEETKNKIKESYKRKQNNKDYLLDYYDNTYNIVNINDALNDFLNNDMPIGEVSKKYVIDKRTLKKCWLNLKLITEEQYQEKRKYYQFKIGPKCRKKKFINDVEICNELYLLIKSNPSKYTIRSLIKTYNESHLNQIDVDPNIVYNKLYELFGNEIFELIANGLHSKEEYEFYKVLKFYFKDKIIKLGYVLQYGSNKRESYYYDICINDKLIIEYDGEGFYHNSEISKIRDKEKEQYAIDHNFIFLRLSLIAAKNIETLKIIKSIIYD